jgi:hypothetical protein
MKVLKQEPNNVVGQKRSPLYRQRSADCGLPEKVHQELSGEIHADADGYLGRLDEPHQYGWGPRSPGSPNTDPEQSHHHLKRSDVAPSSYPGAIGV